MFKTIRKSKITKGLAIFLALNLMTPSSIFALTGGPSQPEVQSFSPIGTSEMVDPFTGDYNYNIPLMDVGGYPINLLYNAGIGMDQEASWVGLGWNINPGVINRSMRGVPDDFKGETITKKVNIKPNQTYKVSAGLSFEVLGIDGEAVGVGLDMGIGIKWNNYVGVGFDKSVNVQVSSGEGGKGPLTAGLGVTSSSDNGLTISPSLSFSATLSQRDKNNTDLNTSIGASFNSRAGLSDLSLKVNVSENISGAKNAKGETVGKSVETGRNEASSSISFGTKTYVPVVNMPMRNTSVTASFKAGVDIIFTDPTGRISGSYSEQRLASKEQNIPSYGFMYAEEGQTKDRAMMDFNREKDGPFSKNTPSLPLTNFTYDVFSVQGQGIGGTFRPFRGDVGYMFDSEVGTTSSSTSLGAELGSGSTLKVGADVDVTIVNTKTTKWKENNNALSKLSFRGDNVIADPLYEPFYFKQVGEKSVDSDINLFSGYGGFDPIRIALEDAGGLEVRAEAKFSRGYASNTRQPLPSVNYRTKREKRNQLMSFLTNAEVPAFAVDNTIPLSSNAKPHHMSEISVLRGDGARYVYGLPLYNVSQKEVSFNASFNSKNCETGLVSYAAGSDNSLGNSRGTDHYYSSTEIKPYAHSYMLTAILSTDYVDLTGDGPSDDDLGDYKLFSYMSNPGIYNWRVPVLKDKANYNEGLKSDSRDNQGNYVYGTKEVKYLERIETKNFIAIFDLEDRADSRGVINENGGKSGSAGNTLKLIKKISLFSKPDFNANYNINPSLSTAVPIKEVHFEYDYSLCQGITNNIPIAGSVFPNQGGKLTLKKVFFTYGHSQKGRLSPYQFNYADNDHNGSMEANPVYSLKGYDRWGNYKPVASGAGCAPGDPLTNAEFSYVEQDNDVQANINAASWNLTSIELPSGGEIKIAYEADDYAYVQHKRAMEMFKVLGASPDATVANMNNTLIDNKYLHFSVPSGTTLADIADMVSGLKENLYFRFLVDMTTNGDFEYVSGYAKYPANPQVGNFDYGLDANGNGYIRLILNATENPIARAAWNFGKLHTPRKVWDQPNITQSGLEQVLTALASSNTLNNVIEMFQGPDDVLKGKGYGDEFNVAQGKSWIRLNTPDKIKKGGGVRVKKIKISDNWGSMMKTPGPGVGSGTFSYGQEYDYTIQEGTKTISSGVAQYEPQLGGDENPWRQPVAFSEDHLLAPSDEHYYETPFGESFFPAPTVGYRRVTVKNLQYTAVHRNATGKVVHEFYTAKDFPTKVKRTDLDARPKRTNPILKLFTFSNKDYMTASQGFVIEVNDMHGKQKAQWVYAEDDPNDPNNNKPISGVEFRYQSSGKNLVNNVQAINTNGTLTTEQVGVEYELVADMRQQKTSIISGGAAFQLNMWVPPPPPAVPIPIPTLYPKVSEEVTRFRGVSMTKLIRRYGILEETIAYDLGSKVSTKNLAYDAETGEVLVTETINDFQDAVFSLKYPAHFAYDRMGQAYKNIGVVAAVNLSTSTNNPERYFVEGDEVAISGVRGWVTKIVPGPAGSIEVVNRQGIPFTGNNRVLTVLRSGRRNQQSVSIGTLTLQTNPLNNFSTNIFDEVLNAGVVEFSDEWRTFCECTASSGGNNPFILGTRGNWRAKRSLLYLTDRLQTRENENTNIREDGKFKTFNPFWVLNSTGSKWLADETNWTWTSEVTEFSPYGFELENKDALDRFSAAVYGYNNTLPTAVASNSRYKEAAFDNFEDYDFGTCTDDHFSYKNSNPDIVDTESHSGRKSIRVAAGSSVEVTKVLVPCDDADTGTGTGGSTGNQ